MMEIGNGNLTLDEEKSHFALWCMTKAPLILGMDLRTISNETLSIISNQQLISVHQNMHAKPATCFIGCSSTNSDFSVYATTVSNGDTVMMLINWNDEILASDDIHVMGQDVGVVPTPSQSVFVTDLWSNETIGTFDFDTLKSLPIPTLAPHASVVYRLSIVDSFTAKSLAGLQIHNSLAQAPPMGWK
jgi:alpha-galactosidase